MGTVVFGTNTSGFDWVTNITSYSGINFSNLTISGASTNPANGTYVATGAIADPTQPSPSAQFVWLNANGWIIQQDLEGEFSSASYAVLRPGPQAYEDRLIYGGYDYWANGFLRLDGYNGHAPAPYGVITAQRTTNYSRYLSLRADGEAVGMIISGLSGMSVGGGITAATLSGDGAGVSNVVPAGYQNVLASLNDARLPQGSVFKNMFATPPMGICTWPQYDWDVSEVIVKMLADGLYTNHLVELGWRLIQIDGGWQAKGVGYSGGRGGDGKLHWSSTFPNPTNTIKYLTDRGLALGLYHEMDGGNEGMHLVGHMAEDVASFKEWGVVYLKLDGGDWTLDGRFAQLSDLRQAMDAAEWRGFIINGGYLMSPTAPYPEARSPLVADAWRLSVDGDLYISTNPPSGLNQLLSHFHHGMQAMTNLAGPERYMDFDFLNIAGMYSAATPQNRTNLVQTALSLWTIGPSSLMIDMVSDGILPFISNRAMIAIHQDPLCLPGGAIAQDSNSEIWIRTLVDGDRAVCVVNKTSSPISPTITLASLGHVPGPNIYKKVYSVWDKRVLSYTTNSFTVSVPAYYANLLRVSK
jgi:alpha-galactosidase